MTQELISLIRDVFPPGDPPGPRVTVCGCGECEEVDRLFGGREWRGVADDFPDYCTDVFPLLSPEARHYYLPAFLVQSLTRPEYVTGLSVYCALERGNVSADQFSAPQRAAVRAWVEWYVAESSEDSSEQVLAAWS